MHRLPSAQPCLLQRITLFEAFLFQQSIMAAAGRRIAIASGLLAAVLMYLVLFTHKPSELASNISDFSHHILSPFPLAPEEDAGNDDDGASSQPPDENLELLMNLCKRATWTEGLWIHCHNECGEDKKSLCGGLNNARNRVQTCMRWGIDAGAGIIIPSVTARFEDDIIHVDGKTVCPDIWWNLERLMAEMAMHCPHLKMRFCDDRTGIENALSIKPPFRHYMAAGHSIGTFRGFVGTQLDLATVSAENPYIVEYGDPYIGWNYREADELTSIRKALFKVLLFNQDLLDLSKELLRSDQLVGRFIGVHLRGESDWPGGFGSLDDQIRLYAAQIETIQEIDDIKTVYVSCGDRRAIQTFRDLLELRGYTVHDKWTLLADRKQRLQEIEVLGFDQKAIVEYHVLLASTFWMGIITSSLSSLIAFARTVDDPTTENFFETYIFPGSSRSGLRRIYPENLTMKGNNYTQLLVVNEVDIMDSFP
jgi:hypothetical protein